jgi:glycosyltransferase involved in cell wall biosynthesis
VRVKFSIVTPCINAEKYISETIESIIFQEGDFEIEYVVVDGASTDRTLEIVKHYVNGVRNGTLPIRCKGVDFTLVSGRDNGIYDALVKGFSLLTGDIVAYLNADDFYQRHAFRIVEHIFTQYPLMKWLTGMEASYQKEGIIVHNTVPFFFYNKFIRKGIYDGRSLPFIQQESTFFKRELLELVDLERLKSFKLAGDYFLWFSFAAQYPLFILFALVSGFRHHGDNRSYNFDTYYEELAYFVEATELTNSERKFLSFCQIMWKAPYHDKAVNNRRMIMWNSMWDSWRCPVYPVLCEPTPCYDLDYRMESTELKKVKAERWRRAVQNFKNLGTLILLDWSKTYH